MKQTTLQLFVIMVFCVLISCQQKESDQEAGPNVIFVITDDQGYGDLACHGNEWIETPTMDKLYEESIRFTNYHCGTTCAPTRSGIMSGKYCNHVNAWHTIMGRENLRAGEYTMANAFADNGYATGHFGKWHLGDGYPYRPHDRGFQVALYHGAGGVGQSYDYWGNDYFDDTYFRNGEPEKFEGYCTDIWFREALQFIETNKNNQFFCYITTNAPHGPYRVAKKYKEMYDSNAEVFNPSFYGMITNIDDNLAILERKLEEWKLKNNTILVFTTDNGSAAGVNLDGKGFKTKGYNAGMRGKKGSKYEGGHRVPLFLRWPGGNLVGGIDLTSVISYTDVFPTLAALCNLELPDTVVFDGISLKSYIEDREKLTDRVIFTDTQRQKNLHKWKDCAVISNRWRLIDGKELYDMEIDPGQTTDIAGDYPEVVEKLRQEYELWWAKVSEHGDEPTELYVDSSKENPAVIGSHDLLSKGHTTWNQKQVRAMTDAQGHWNLNFVHSRKYEFRLQRWPAEANLAFNEPAPAGDIDEAGQLYPEGKAMKVKKAVLKIAGKEFEKEVDPTKSYIGFNLEIEAGSHQMEATFIDEEGKERSAYYVYIY